MQLADTSAWTNRGKDPAVARWFEELVESGELATCAVVRMELLWTARDHEEFVDLRQDLAYVDDVAIDGPVWDRAIEVFESLSAGGPLHHRQVNIEDLVIAAAAERAQLEILHYDRDFDVIAEVTGQPVRAIAPIGSL
jgi:predicted nucleic acid-binding protein